VGGKEIMIRITTAAAVMISWQVGLSTKLLKVFYLAEINDDDLFSNNVMISKEKVTFYRSRMYSSKVNIVNARIQQAALRMHF
jgi:hypothetical protein